MCGVGVGVLPRSFAHIQFIIIIMRARLLELSALSDLDHDLNLK
jgi:hypothetical protein